MFSKEKNALSITPSSVIDNVIHNKLDISKKKPSIPSVIVADLNIEGDLVSEGIVEIAGNVTGNIKCNAVIIRKEASIKGDIKADYLEIIGEVTGILFAKHIVVKAGANIDGSVKYQDLSIEKGAVLNVTLEKFEFEGIADNIKDKSRKTKNNN